MVIVPLPFISEHAVGCSAVASPVELELRLPPPALPSTLALAGTGTAHAVSSGVAPLAHCAAGLLSCVSPNTRCMLGGLARQWSSQRALVDLRLLAGRSSWSGWGEDGVKCCCRTRVRCKVQGLVSHMQWCKGVLCSIACKQSSTWAMSLLRGTCQPTSASMLCRRLMSGARHEWLEFGNGCAASLTGTRRA